MFKIKVGNDHYSFEDKIRLETLSQNYEGSFFAAKVNNRLRELTYEVGFDADVEFLDYTYYDSTRMYATSMRYLICMAFYRIFPELQIKFSNSISMGIYGRAINGVLTPDMIQKIIEEMKRIIQADYPIIRKKNPSIKYKNIMLQKDILIKSKL
ncbi:MAG: hypothetical protein KJ971_00315 [Firmicutes bacterium]|nr:hypothetical protein [Bacillota bacterium]